VRYRLASQRRLRSQLRRLSPAGRLHGARRQRGEMAGRIESEQRPQHCVSVPAVASSIRPSGSQIAYLGAEVDVPASEPDRILGVEPAPGRAVISGPVKVEARIVHRAGDRPYKHDLVAEARRARVRQQALAEQPVCAVGLGRSSSPPRSSARSRGRARSQP
jgi:hypothetical protein